MGNAQGGGGGRDGGGEAAALLPQHRQQPSGAEELSRPLLAEPPQDAATATLASTSPPTFSLTSSSSSSLRLLGRVTAVRDYHASGGDALSFTKGEVIPVVQDVRGWWVGHLHGRLGLVPSTHCSSLQPASAEDAAQLQQLLAAAAPRGGEEKADPEEAEEKKEPSAWSALQRSAQTAVRPARPLPAPPRGDHRSIAVASTSPRSSSSRSWPAAASSSSASSSPYASTSPVELWVSIFSFLQQADLARAAAVSRRWASTAYDPALWSSIHLCHRYHKVDDSVVALLLSSSRFPRLAHLCLDRCSAITDRALGYVQAFCPHLQHLSLAHCHRITREGVLAYIAGSEVRKVELIGGMAGWTEVVSGVAEMGREVDLGFFLLEWLAKEGVRLKRRRRWSLAHLPPTAAAAHEQAAGGDEEEEEKSAAQQQPRHQQQQPPVAAGSSTRPAPSSGPLALAAAAAILPVPAGGPAAAAARGGAGGVGVAGAGVLRVGGVELVRAVCRHSRSVAGDPSASACWGEVRGRVVVSSCVYHTAGNYPVQVLYSCEQHSDTDLSDVRFHRCQVCEQLFLPSSMYSEVVCNVCYDAENVSRRQHWIQLNTASIRQFGLSEVVGKTIRVAERKNLPITLTSFKTTPCNLDYSLPPPQHDDVDEGGGEGGGAGQMEEPRLQSETEEEKRGSGRRSSEEDPLDDDDDDGGERGEMKEDGETHGQHSATGRRSSSSRAAQPASAASSASSSSSASAPAPMPSSLTAPTSSTALLSAASLPDPTSVPLTLFLSHNAARLDRTVESLQGHLRAAYSRGCTRALLVLDDEEQIEVLADSRVIADGLEGESHLKLVALIWQHLALLVASLALLVLTAAYYKDAFTRLLYGETSQNPRPYRGQFLGEQSPFDALDWGLLSAILAFFFVLLIAAVVLFRRYRRLFELVFRKFLALDIFAIFAFGTLCVVVTSSMLVRLPLDALSTALLTLNVSFLAVYVLYYDVSVQLHTLAVVYLNAIMAVLLSGALNGSVGFWLPFVLCLLVALLDLELRPYLRLPPLLVPESMIIPSKPTILLCLNQVYVRPGELTLYGLMVTLVGSFDVLTVIGVVGLWVLLVLVLPFVSGARRWRRPLPFLLAYTALLWWKADSTITPARFKWNALSV